MTHRTQTLAWLFALSGAFVVAACTLSPSQGQFACQTEADCPSGWQCRKGFCYSGFETVATESHSSTEGTDTESQTSSETHTSSGTDTDTTTSSTDTDTQTGSDTSTTDTDTGTGTGTGTGEDTGTGSGTGTGEDTGTGTGTGTGEDTGTGTGTGTGSDTGTGSETDTFPPDGWLACKVVRVTNTTSAALNGFPVPVRFNVASHSAIYSQAQVSGADLRFFANDQVTSLPHEIESWDPWGNSVVWVRVPVVPASPSTSDIYLCYGNASASDAQDPAGVWTAYTGVWHLAEASGTVATNSTGAADGQYLGSPTLGSKGPLGDVGAVFGPGQAIDLDDFPLGGTQMTVEAVVYVSNCPNAERKRIFARAEEGATFDQHEVRLSIAYNNPVKCQVEVGVRSDTGTPVSNFGFTFNSGGRWLYLALVFGGGIVRLYADGVEQQQTPLLGSLLNSPAARASWAASLLPNVSTPFNDTLTEARISNSALSANWIAAQHAAMTTTTFAQIQDP